MKIISLVSLNNNNTNTNTTTTFFFSILLPKTSLNHSLSESINPKPPQRIKDQSLYIYTTQPLRSHDLTKLNP